MILDKNGWPMFWQQPVPKEPKREIYCKLRTDKRTVIFVKSKESLDNWMKLYPKAEIITLKIMNYHCFSPTIWPMPVGLV